jgi:SAM-dependent methyltransferase
MPDRGATSSLAWSSSAYPAFAPNLLPAIARLVRFAGVGDGDRVLDAGCGTGNVSLTARRAGADVVGFDLTRGMLHHARDNAAVEGTGVDLVQGDVAGTPFATDAFDAALSSFGHVFAPDVAGAASELTRVTAPGGRVAFAAWSPYGVVGALGELAAEYVDGEGHDPTRHLQWGRPERVADLLDGVEDLEFRHGEVSFRFVSPAHFWRQVAEESGPLVAAVEQLPDAAARRSMRAAALDRLDEFFEDNAVRAEYLLARGTVA